MSGGHRIEGKATFAMRLRQAREELGLSQKALGIKAGIDEFVASARINQYERGKHVPDMLTARRLAHELSIPVSFLYEPDEDLAELVRRAYKLPRQRLKELLGIIDGLPESLGRGEAEPGEKPG